LVVAKNGSVRVIAKVISSYHDNAPDYGNENGDKPTVIKANSFDARDKQIINVNPNLKKSLGL
jgi:hypothetical protein